MMGYALSVSVDERAFSLAEMPFKTADEKAIRRFQVIRVNRADRLAEFRTDLGPWRQGDRAFAIPAFWEHTVGELRDMADKLRTENNQWLDEQIAKARSQPMGAQWLEQVEKYRQIVANRSVFGRKVLTQRNGFSKE